MQHMEFRNVITTRCNSIFLIPQNGKYHLLKPALKPAAQPVPSTRTNFKNCTDLRTVHPAGVPKGHAADQSKVDRDKDGWACER